MTYNLATGRFEEIGKPDSEDKRLTVRRSVTVVRSPGAPFSCQRRRMSKPRLHKGTMKCCPVCNPVDYQKYRRLEEMFAARRTR